jgi:hypothetical protein
MGRQGRVHRGGCESPTYEVEAVKQLKLWNGRVYGVLPQSDWKGTHLYVAAYSAADARRLCLELGYADPGANEVKKYWSPCWGNAMEGITPERGIWVSRGAGERAVERLQPKF